MNKELQHSIENMEKRFQQLERDNDGLRDALRIAVEALQEIAAMRILDAGEQEYAARAALMKIRGEG